MPRVEGAQSIERLISILECFTLERPELPLGDVAETAKLPKPTVFRMLHALKQYHYIEQDERSGLYRLGFRLYALGAIVASQMDLRRTALPIMQDLAEQTKETVNLNIVDRSERVCIELVEGSQGIRNFVRIGARNSLLSGASGKVLLAHLDAAQAETVLQLEFPDQPRDQALRTRLFEENAKVRETGVAISFSQRVSGAAGISCPIYDRTQTVVAGLTVSGPEERIRGQSETIVRLLKDAASRLSERLGYLPRP